jgi:hypothetical protein
MTNITLSIDDEVYKKMRKIYADGDILAKNWLSKEDEAAWKNL